LEARQVAESRIPHSLQLDIASFTAISSFAGCAGSLICQLAIFFHQQIIVVGTLGTVRYGSQPPGSECELDQVTHTANRYVACVYLTTRLG
jgi:hypothetical protein